MTVGGEIRMAGAEDAPAIAAIYRPYVTDAVTSFEVEAPSAPEMARRIESVLTVAPWLVSLDAAGQPMATPMPRGTPSARRTNGRSMSPSMYATDTSAAEWAGRSIGRSSRCCGYRVSTSHMPGSRCPTLRASGSTNHWIFARWASTRPSAGNSAPGATLDGGTFRCRRGPTRPRRRFHWPTLKASPLGPRRFEPTVERRAGPPDWLSIECRPVDAKDEVSLE